jgi:hypothetical protein
MDSTVVAPNGTSGHPSPIGGTLTVPMSCDTVCMRAVDSRDCTRFPDGDTSCARCVRPNARRSLMVPIGVLPAGRRVRQFEHLGRSDPIGRCRREMSNCRTAKDGFLSRGG